MIKYSIVIPVYNEEESIAPLYKQIVYSFNKIISKDKKDLFELIFVDDGSTDSTPLELRKIEKESNVKVITLRKNFGKAAALSYGFSNSKGEIIFTMDGDLQDDPAEAVKLLKKLNEGYDMVSGWKLNRQDPADKKITSKIFNFFVSKVSGVKIHDMNCGFKVYRSDVVKNINIYSQLYRFIPILAAEKGFIVGEQEIIHRKRLFGKSKYNWKRIFIGLIDLFTIMFITRFAKRPLHLFAPIGALSLLIGLIIFIYLFIQHLNGKHIGDIPLLISSITILLAGLQIIMTGLLAELIVNINHNKNDYPIKNYLNNG